jgi:hypothetical protein
VWRRRMEGPGEVILGRVRRAEANMYGIAAVPLDEKRPAQLPKDR